VDDARFHLGDDVYVKVNHDYLLLVALPILLSCNYLTGKEYQPAYWKIMETEKTA
jgi:hypothetical protein